MGGMLEKRLQPMPGEALLLVNLSCSLFMTGLIWFVQIVHYPLFERIGAQDFALYEERHQSRTTWVVAPVMLVELLGSIALVLSVPSCKLYWTAGALTLMVWASTVLLQMPLHSQLAKSFEAGSFQRLVASNWVRTIAWSLRSLILLWTVLKRNV